MLAWLRWLGERARQHQSERPLQVLSTLPLGTHQKVVLVKLEAGPHSARLVLGVSTQQIQCLHVLPAAESSETTIEDTARSQP